MLENLKDKADALTQIADIIGKKPLVIMVIVLLFTVGYLYKDNRKEERRLNDVRIEELKEIIKDIKEKQDIYIPKLDTTISKTNKTLERLNNK